MNSRLRAVFLVFLAGFATTVVLCIVLLATGQVRGPNEDRVAGTAGWCFCGFLVTVAVHSLVQEQFRLEFRRYLLRVMALTTRKGLSLGHAFLALAEDFDGPRRKVVYRVLGILDEGKPLSEALAVGARKIVPPHVLEAIRAAERSGRLAETLEAAVEESQAVRSNRATVGRSLLYPFAILMVGLFVTTYILPQFGPIFGPMVGRRGHPLELPTATVVTMAVANLLVNHLFGYAILLAIPLTPFLLPSVRRRFRWLLDPLSFRVPLWGRLRRLEAGERVCRILAGFVRAGVPLEEALPQAAASSGSQTVQKSAEEAVAALRAGKPADQALQCLRLPRFVRARAAATTGGTPERFAASLEALARECQWRRLRLGEILAGSAYPLTLLFGGAYVFLIWLGTFGAITTLQGAMIPW